MKILSNGVSPLPFYDDTIYQNHNRDYALGQIYPLVTYKNMLLPFQVVIAKGSTTVEEVSLINYNTGGRTDITNSFKENGLKIINYPSEDFDILVYPGNLPVTDIKHEGRYYLAINIEGLGDIYSEIFTVSSNVDDYLLIEYSNSKNLRLKKGLVRFQDNFSFKCYLCTQIGKPEYIFEEEATERMGYTFIESQVSKKVYKFTFLAPEYLCDALRAVRLCDTRRIASKLQSYDLTAFGMEPKWEEQGDLAVVECEFETDTVISSVGGFEQELLGGDFNNSYNNDFDKQ